MAQILFSVGVQLYRITRTMLKTYKTYKRKKQQHRERELEGYIYKDKNP